MIASQRQKWNIFGSAEDLDVAKALLLRKRGFNSVEEASKFLEVENPLKYLSTFPSEFKKSLKKAAHLIEKSIEDGRPIVVHGDYDADGVCATAILYNYLKKERGYDSVFYFIPNRFKHGYGLSKESLEDSIELVGKNVEEAEKILFITVDSGITSTEEILYLKELGHSVIITDHHQKPKKLPEADVLVWNDEIVGATLAWVLTKVLGSKDSYAIALSALATVTDVQPILGMNRALVKYGLEIINNSPPQGIKELIQVSGVNDKEIDTYGLGWVLGPRINAAGRLEDASQAVRLFTSEDSRIAYSVAKSLNKINFRRQEETTRMFELATGFSSDKKFILAQNSEFHEGIIGLIASRLVRKHYRPAIVISVGEKDAKGSVRSIEGINIIEILREFDHLFIDLGGHPMAAGFTMLRENISSLETCLQEIFQNRFDDDIFIPTLSLDAEIPLSLADWDLLKFIEKLRPFGEGNKSPLFLTRNLGVVNINFVGREKNHVSLKFFDGEGYRKGIFFSSREYFEDISLGDKVDVVYSLQENNFRGNSSIDLIVKDIRKS